MVKCFVRETLRAACCDPIVPRLQCRKHGVRLPAASRANASQSWIIEEVLG